MAGRVTRRKFTILLRAVAALPRFRLRSGLTILSAVLGVAGALTSINYALGGRAKLVDQLSRLGTNLLIVTPAQSRSVGGRARTGAPVTTLTLSDYGAIRRDVPLFSRSSAFSVGTYLIKAGDLAKKSCVVIGIEPDYTVIKRWPLHEGSVFETSDLRRFARVALLGSTVARDLFGDASPVGERVLINRVPFEVVGVMAERGQTLDAANEDDQVYVPLTTAMHRLTSIEYLRGILLTVNRWDEMDEAAAATSGVLSRRHAKAGRTRPDFQVNNQKQLLDTQLAASAKLLFLVRWIGISALCVGGLGILAISWMGVRDRTRELGTRRALGATRQDIFWQVVAEACAMSILGCLLGALTAYESSTLLARWVGQPAVFDEPSAWLSIGAASVVNIAFAGLPARMAAMLDPILALAFE